MLATTSAANVGQFQEAMRPILAAGKDIVSKMCIRDSSYTACLHFGEQGGCFYGGPMVDEVYPCLLYTSRCV